MKRTLLVFATLVLLWTVTGLLNQAVAGAHLHFFLGGLYITFAAVALAPMEGLAAVLLGGAVCDAHSPTSFGTQILLFAAAHAFLRHLRDRIPHEEVVGRVAIALICNLGLYLAMSFAWVNEALNPSAYWVRALVDLLASQILLALIAPWFFALQERAAAYARD
jgi:hypothetical protein